MTSEQTRGRLHILKDENISQEPWIFFYLTFTSFFQLVDSLSKFCATFTCLIFDLVEWWSVGGSITPALALNQEEASLTISLIHERKKRKTFSNSIFNFSL